MVVPCEVGWTLKPEAPGRSPLLVPALLQQTLTLLQLHPDPQCWWPVDLQNNTTGFRQGILSQKVFHLAFIVHVDLSTAGQGLVQLY